MTKLHAEAYLEYIYGTSSKFYSIALLENDNGTWSMAFNYGRIGQPRDWGYKAAQVAEPVARKAFDAALRDKSDYTKRAAVPTYATYPGATRVGLGALGTNPAGAATGAAKPSVTSGVLGAKQILGAPQSIGAAQALPSTGGTSGINEPQPDDGGVPRFPAQLCGERGSIEPALADPARYAVEEKLDGFRGLVAILPGPRFEIRNRDGINKGRIENTPHLRAALADLVKRRPELARGTLLDGELVGKSWNETATLLSARGGSDAGLRYVVFDIPWFAGRDQRRETLRERRVTLESLAVDFDGAVIVLSEFMSPSRGLAAQVWGKGGEGLIIKDLNTSYTPGDRRMWTKIKQEHTADGVILGYIGGAGKYSDTTGAISIGQYVQGKLVEVCKLSGMTDAERRSLDAHSVGRVVEFAYQDRTAASYRHPRWSRWRDDKKPTDCVWENS